MKIMVVDTEEKNLQQTVHAIRQVYAEAVVTCFVNPTEALRYAMRLRQDIVFSKWHMQACEGMQW